MVHFAAGRRRPKSDIPRLKFNLGLNLSDALTRVIIGLCQYKGQLGLVIFARSLILDFVNFGRKLLRCH